MFRSVWPEGVRGAGEKGDDKVRFRPPRFRSLLLIPQTHGHKYPPAVSASTVGWERGR